MDFLLVVVFLGLHVAASTLLAAFGIHRLVIAWQYTRLAKPHRSRRPTPPTDFPFVTVQLPLYNERYVAERAIRAVAGLDYPRSRFEIQVLDDSTDETSIRVTDLVRHLQARGVQIKHFRRAARTGYKAGALAEGLKDARGEFVAIFDADFVVRPDFLLRSLPEFRDPAVGMVQARWSHLNAHTSLLTRAQALQLDAHFTIEHGVRAGTGCFFNFNGTAGVWRRAAIEDGGGWQADTLTEDLDLSYRAQMAGWRFVYRDDITVPSELPVEVAAYRIQQQRWAQGGVQTARKLLPDLLRARLTGRVKRAATWHLLIHFAYPLLVLVTAAGLVVGLLADSLAMRWVLAVDGLLLTFAMGSLTFFYGVAAYARRRDVAWGRRLLLVPAIMVLGAGIAFGQTVAVLRGLSGHHAPFRRTPKYRLSGNTDLGWQRAAYRIHSGRPALVEFLGGASLIGAAAIEALRTANLPSGLVLLLGVGLICVGGASLLQQRRTIPSRD